MISYFKNHHLLSIVISIFLINTIFYSNGFYPTNDSLSIYHTFSHFYSSLYFNHEIPLWFPFSGYGTHTDAFIFLNISMSNYLSVLIGYIFQIQNTLNLFILSNMIDMLFFSLGCYYLTYSLNKNKVISIYIAIISMLILFIDNQLYFGIKLICSLPFSLYFINLFFQTQKIKNILLALIILLIFSFGSVGYTLVIQFYILLLYFSVNFISELIWARRINKKWLKKITLEINKIETFIYFFIILFLTSSVFYFYQQISHSYSFNGIDRIEDFKNTKDVFLNYGGFLSIDKLQELFISKPFSINHDFLIYSGLISFVMFLFGVWILKDNKNYLGVYSLFLFTVYLINPSLGFAKIFYYLPGFDKVRHIGYFGSLFKISIIIGSSLALTKTHLIFNKNYKYHLLIFIFLFINIIFQNLNGMNFYNIHTLVISLLLSLTVILFFYTKTVKKFVIYILVFLSLLDYVAYRVIYNFDSDSYGNASIKSEFKIAKKIQFVERKKIDIDDFYEKKFETFNNKQQKHYYSLSNSFFNIDSCSQPKQDIVGPLIMKLLNNERNLIRYINDPADNMRTFNIDSLEALISCDSSKITFWKSAKYDYSLTKNMIQVPVEYSLDQFTNNKIKLKLTENNYDSLIIKYADSFSNKWKAYVNEAPADILIIDKAFKGVKLPENARVIEFVYVDKILSSIVFILFLLLPSLFFYVINYPKRLE